VSRSSNYFSIESIFLLATLVLSIPTGLHAEPNSQPNKKVVNTNNQELTQPLAPKTESSLPNPQQTTPDRPKQPIATPVKKPSTTATKTAPAPVMEVVNLVLNLKDKRVYVHKGDKVIAKYPVAIGKKGWETPVGEWQVMEKVKNPGWTNFKTGEVLKPGKENPLGVRWIGFWTDGEDVIGFHGTPDIKSVGTAASHGCVRMYNRDVTALFKLVEVGTTVKVVEQ
jgi:lipoprotein-anchoring transpeptidase ErfK/SrfK